MTASANWPALKGTIFESGPIEAAVYSGSGFWFFQGTQCAKTNTEGTGLLVNVTDITAGGNWPALDT
ncbi:hypothetical protein [Nonomuraea typhae]|uniref:Uncharacterized protein n=1 Tax=Nonomuraea typhae TaxID=2603600 RepID=A0ABW7ZBR2_9ACTN